MHYLHYPSTRNLAKKRILLIVLFSCTAIIIYTLLHLNLLQFDNQTNDNIQVEVQFLQGSSIQDAEDERNLLNSGQDFNLEEFLENLGLFTSSANVVQTTTASKSLPVPATVNLIANLPVAAPATVPPTPTQSTTKAATTPRAESDFDLYINTRRLVILAVRRLNQVLEEIHQKAKANNSSNAISSNSTTTTSSSSSGGTWPCAKWWANPTRTQRNEIIHSSPAYDDHLLEFEAASPWDKVTFQTMIRVYVAPRQREFEFLPSTGTGNFTRAGSFQRFLAKNEKLSCFSGEAVNQTAKLGAADKETLRHLCSCDYSKIAPEEMGSVELPTWPLNSSFLVGDYMNFSNYGSMFHILPAKHKAHCAPAGLKLLVMVSSAPKHFSHRAVIRETYGSRQNLGKNQAELVFLFGRVGNSTLQEQLEAEAKTHSDIIQANFMDSYHNLTLSHLSMYSYVHHSCLNGGGGGGGDQTRKFDPPKHVLKADDDFLLNIGIAGQVAEANPEAELIGCSYCGTPPILHRAYMTKYYTPKYMYMGSRYPGYLSGVAYLIRSDVLPKFIDAAQTVPIIHMDDAYMTGLLPKALGIYPRNSKRFSYGRFEPNNTCELRKMANSYVLNHDDMRAQWATLQSTSAATAAAAVAVAAAAANCKAQIYPNDFKVENMTEGFKNTCNYS